MTFRFAYGLSSSSDLATVPRLISQLIPKSDPLYLISCIDLNEKFSLPGFFGLSESFITNNFIGDSGAFSVANSQVYIDQIRPEQIAREYNKYNFLIGIGPDIHLINDSESAWLKKRTFMTSLQTTVLRSKLFYQSIEATKFQHLCDVIHGPLSNRGQFSVYYINKWFEGLKKVGNKLSEGVAMAPPSEMKDLSKLAYLLLFPWSKGITQFHVLAKGNIRGLPLYIYIADKLYELFSADAKTYTIDTLNNLSYMIPNNMTKPISKKCGRKTFKRESFPICNCLACQHFEKIFNMSLKELFTLNQDGKALDTNRKLNQWLPTHNVFIVQEFIDRLKLRVCDRKPYIEYLQAVYSNRTSTELIKAIDLVDRLVADGPTKYRKNIRLVRDV